MKKAFVLLSASVLSVALNTCFAEEKLLEVKESITVNAAPAKVWALIGGFNDLPKWHPAIAKSSVETKDNKTQRLLTLKAPNDPTIVETLLNHDDAKMSYSYDITKVDPALLPVQNYKAVLTVMPAPAGASTVVWEAHFLPAGKADDATAKKAIQSVFLGGLNNLAPLLVAPAKKDVK